jgi:integrase
MSPKQRLKENRSLPKRWAWKHGSLYYLVPKEARYLWDNKSWFKLGKTLAEAHRAFSERLHHFAETNTMQDLLDRFQFEHLPTLAPATQKYYLYGLPMVRKVFTTHPVPVELVEPHHAYQMVDHLSKTESTKKAKQAAECLSSALSFAVRKGVIKRNPLIGQFEKPSTAGRERKVSDSEFIAFASTLPRKWQLYLMLKLHAKGRRKGELLRIMRSDLKEDGIHFRNNKRKSDSFVISWTPDLKAIVQEILELHPPRVGDAPLFFNRTYQPYMRPDGTCSGFDSMWQRHMRSAIEKGICEHFTEHDLRAKAVENEDLETAAKLLRHTSTQVTKKHYRRKPEVI